MAAQYTIPSENHADLRGLCGSRSSKLPRHETHGPPALLRRLAGPLSDCGSARFARIRRLLRGAFSMPHRPSSALSPCRESIGRPPRKLHPQCPLGSSGRFARNRSHRKSSRHEFHGPDGGSQDLVERRGHLVGVESRLVHPVANVSGIHRFGGKLALKHRSRATRDCNDKVRPDIAGGEGLPRNLSHSGREIAVRIVEVVPRPRGGGFAPDLPCGPATGQSMR